MKQMNNRKPYILICLLFTVYCLLAALQAASAEPKTKKEKRKAKKAAAAKGKEDTTQKLLAEQEKKRGATFPGKDPAFLVLPRPFERTALAQKQLTAEVKESISKGISFLTGKQNADGSWSDRQFPSNTGVTALACLALMAEGNRPRIGPHGKALDRGVEFLLKSAKEGGLIAGPGSNKYGPMYEHLISTLALLYSYGNVPWYPQTRDVISRALEVIKRSQRLDGGWRYLASSEGHSDVSVTANVLWVLRTAKKAGFVVTAKSIQNGLTFVEGCAMPDGYFKYRAFGLRASPSLTGTCIVALCNAGKLDHELIPTARDRIVYEYKRYSVKEFTERRYAVYGVFYASMAMYTCGDVYWAPWFPKGVRILMAMQRKGGEFADEHENTVYTTSMALMVLQAPLGYLPLYER